MFPFVYEAINYNALFGVFIGLGFILELKDVLVKVMTCVKGLSLD